MELTYKPKHLLSKDLNIIEHNQKIGRIIYPWGQIFMKYGRAKMVINHEIFSMNFPVRDFGFIGKDRTVAMTLYTDDSELAKVHFFHPGLVDRFVLEFQGKKFSGQMNGARSFIVTDEEGEVASFKFYGLFYKKCDVCTKNLPIEIASLVVWALHNPLQFL